MKEMSLSELFEVAKTHILYGLREYLSEDKNRRRITQELIERTPELHDPPIPLSFTKTFTKNVKEEIDTYLKTRDTTSPLMNANKLIAFSAAFDPPRNGEEYADETHYLTFIVHRIQPPGSPYVTKSVLYVIDPSYHDAGDEYERGGVGIYNDVIFREIKRMVLSSGFLSPPNGLDPIWAFAHPQTTSRPQKGYDDVFCQTWSILLFIETLKKIVSAYRDPDADAREAAAYRAAYAEDQHMIFDGLPPAARADPTLIARADASSTKAGISAAAIHRLQPIDIADTKIGTYGQLLSFYQDIIKIPGICDDILKEYRESVRVNVSDRFAMKKKLLNLFENGRALCKSINEMKPEDLLHKE